MENFCPLWLSVFVVLFVATTSRFCHAVDQDRQVYIIYMGALPEGKYSPSSHHVNMLQEAIGPNYASQHLVRSYTRSFNAFAAYLTEEERQNLSSFEGVVSVFPNRIRQPQTTRSWDFMGFPTTRPRNTTAESDVILGLIDTGIWPESESFSDEGLSSVPGKWKGACEGGKNFTCNKKIIGARWYSVLGGEDSARDIIGHGSHTASIAAGNNVKDASFYGFAQGVARGAVPSARIAAYKVCQSKTGCHDSDILAAFDDAIADGVDIISISIGGPAIDFCVDSISIGAFHAMERGILTIQAAGNEGLQGVPTSGIAPWTITVAASSTDRRIVNKVVLGNTTTTIVGDSIDTFKTGGRKYPLVYGKRASTVCNELSARNCEQRCLDRNKVKGKIVICDLRKGLIEAHVTGAFGSIVPSAEHDASSIVPFPAAALSDMGLLRDYMNSTKTPMADILISEAIPNPDAPTVAKFSSRGPNVILREILKPDITAPGIEILAAFSPLASLTNGDPFDKRSVKYSILSGTSMACPHVAGAAAYVKSFHPEWSPSAIKSALMTTAREMNGTKTMDNELSYGAGHIDPVKAVNPGLVYEIFVEEYVHLLCSMDDYDSSDIAKVVGNNFTCPIDKMTAMDLNYPSMAARAKDAFTLVFKRTVTNVGLANLTYKARITTSAGLNITVKPNILSFESLSERKSFVVTVRGTVGSTSIASAALIWSDGPHSVRSPIVVYDL